ncbi:hypothetical protein GF352_04525 [archaeon]|nr:hypothetical protein [archaeon]
MKKKISIIGLLLLLAGCTAQEPLELIVTFHATGCAGFNENFSEVDYTPSGLSIITNIISDKPCYTLIKAELTRNENDLTIYFTLDEDRGDCIQCTGLQTFIYEINGPEINRSGINVKVITLLEDQEVNHTFTT